MRLLTFRDLFRENHFYLFILIGLTLSSIGSGLTQVAVYGALNKMGGTPFDFALGLVVSLIPGIFAGWFAANLIKLYDSFLLLVLAQVFGAFAIFLVFYTSSIDNKYVLYFAEFIGCLISGFIFPLIQKIIKDYIQEKYLKMIIKLESALFSVNIILGVGVGSLIFDQVGGRSFFIIDIITYVISAVMLYFASRLSLIRINSEVNDIENQEKSYIFRSFDAKKLNAFLLLPLLCLAMAPGMALLPYFGSKHGQSVIFFGLTLTPAVVFIFAKCLGQMIGPFCVKDSWFQEFSEKPLSLLFPFSFSFLCYLFVSNTDSFVLSLVSIMLAHILSNIVFTVGAYRLQKDFSSDEIGPISARQYQLQIGIMCMMSLTTGYLSKILPSQYVLIGSFFIALLMILILQKRNNTINILN